MTSVHPPQRRGTVYTAFVQDAAGIEVQLVKQQE
jgi:hypothetical protein